MAYSLDNRGMHSFHTIVLLTEKGTGTINMGEKQ